jgi:hypothetical protein
MPAAGDGTLENQDAAFECLDAALGTRNAGSRTMDDGCNTPCYRNPNEGH